MSIWKAMWGFDGRISRKYFWLAVLVWMIASLIVFFSLLHWLSGGQWIDEQYSQTLEAEKIINFAGLISSLLGLYPFLAMSIKRLHDMNLSGWWCFAPWLFSVLPPLIGLGDSRPFILSDSPASPTLLSEALYWGANLAIFIVLGFVPGTAGPNRLAPTR
jgi:uncharacterized membrane protein YhaH (DUF805 family)